MGLRILGVIIPIIIIAFSYGVAVGLYEYFPYEGLNQTKKIILNESDKSIITSTDFAKFDISSIIRIDVKEDISSKKTSLIQYIWKDQMPTKLPTSVEENFTDENFNDVKNLKQLDKITIEMEHGVNSIAYFFIPYESNNKLIIYHHGHAGDFILEKNTITFFLNNGYSVVAFNMPLKGINSQPIIETSDFGPIKFIFHDQFPLLESPNFSPMKYFVEPIALSLNFIEQNYDYDEYYMVGISGGGWTTIIYSAIDQRISQSYSVAGSYPLYLRQEVKNLGDYEQNNLDIYRISNYLELYTMSSFGNDRKLVQLFIYNDPCCFQAELYEKFPYGEIIQNRLEILGSEGKFSVFLDNSTNQHEISDHALGLILDEMLNKG
tara:strand:- start:273 stop:1406 length:1134 start_codon:yes stop_codon:yes gene_type:complete